MLPLEILIRTKIDLLLLPTIHVCPQTHLLPLPTHVSLVPLLLLVSLQMFLDNPQLQQFASQAPLDCLLIAATIIQPIIAAPI